MCMLLEHLLQGGLQRLPFAFILVVSNPNTHTQCTPSDILI